MKRIVKNEADRYLGPCLEHLLGFCDEIRVLDDGSTDDFREIDWAASDRVLVERTSTSTFFEHEGRARQRLLEWTMEGQPTHVLAIDADEFVTDGAAIRRVCETPGRTTVWLLDMVEVWNANEDELEVRIDGGWAPRPVPILYAVPRGRNPRTWAILDRPGGCGREPVAVAQLRSRARPSGSQILHFGWTCEADRPARHARYADAKSFGHNPRHIASIMWPDEQVAFRHQEWPPSLAEFRDQILARANQGLQPVITAPPLPDTVAELWQHEDGRWVALGYDGKITRGIAHA
jgi:hypothetical protein